MREELRKNYSIHLVLCIFSFRISICLGIWVSFWFEILFLLLLLRCSDRQKTWEDLFLQLFKKFGSTRKRSTTSKPRRFHIALASPFLLFGAWFSIVLNRRCESCCACCLQTVDKEGLGERDRRFVYCMSSFAFPSPFFWAQIPTLWVRKDKKLALQTIPTFVDKAS